MRFVIIGASAAGVSAAETLRKHDPQAEIAVISDETAVYSRPLLSYYLAGKLGEKDLLYRPPDFFRRLHVEPHLGVKAIGLDPQRRQLKLDNGATLDCDRLLLATGAAARLPQIEGIDKSGVFALRKIEDAQGMLALLTRARRAVILGGGLVGLKVAAALKERGLEVTVLVDSPHVLSQMVDESTARIYEEIFQSNGVRIMLKARPVAVMGKQRATGVKLASGEELPADLICVGKGVDACLELVTGTGIKTEYGVLVNQFLSTSVAGIYAAGDVAQALDQLRGEAWVNALWPCAVEQGRIAAMNMLGQRAAYQGSMRMNSVQFFDVPVISAGLAVLSPGRLGARTGEHDETMEERRAATVYKKVYLKDNTIVGFVLVGEIEPAGLLRALMAKAVDVAAVKDELLKPRLNFGRLLPLIAEHKDRFAEREFRELIQSVRATAQTVAA